MKFQDEGTKSPIGKSIRLLQLVVGKGGCQGGMESIF